MYSPFSRGPRIFWESVFVSALMTIVFVTNSPAQGASEIDVYFGTEGNNCDAAEGIYLSTFSSDTNRLSAAKLLLELKGAGWLSFHPKKSDVIYSTANIDGQPSVVAVSNAGPFATILSSQRIGDGGACFLTTDLTGSLLISAQYGGGSVAVFPLQPDGSIGQRSQLLEHAGGSRVVAGNQDAPHPHCVAISPDNRFAFVPDLGLDQLVAYKFDLENKQLLPHVNVDVIPGGGPRHMKFHPTGRYAFVLNELALSVTVFRYDAETGTMQRLATVEALTESEKSENLFNSASEIRINHSNNQIYTANRGHDSISVFEFDETSAALTRTQIVPVHGSWPRNFNISPDGQFVFVAGKDSNTVSLFTEENGKLFHQEHKSIFVPGPICVAIGPQVEK